MSLLLACCKNSDFKHRRQLYVYAVLHAGTMPEIFSGERNPENGMLHLAKQAPYTKMVSGVILIHADS